MWKKRIIQALWIAAGIGTVVLLGAAMQKKNHKICNEVKIEITGAEEHMFIDEKDVLNILNASGEVKGRDISSINLRKMEEELELNPWVKNAEMFFDNQQVLMVSIEERQPTARIFTNQGSSFYIDTAGIRLPLSDKISARVPVFTNFPSDKKVMAHSDSLLMNDVVELSSFIMADSFWMAQVAQIDVMPDATFEIIPVIGNQTISIGNAEELEDKFSRLYTFYSKAWLQNGMNKYERLDVRFNNQIVAVKRGMNKGLADTARVSQLVNKLMLGKTDSVATNRVDVPPVVRKRDSVNRVAKPVVKPPVKRLTNKPVVKPEQPKPNENKPRAVMNNRQ